MVQNKGNGNVGEMAVSSFCYHIGFIHPILFYFSTLFLVVCVYSRLIFICCLGEDKMMTLYNEEKKSFGREERGRPLREVELVENFQACQFQLVHSGLWTQHFYFSCPLRERQMLSFCSPT